MGYPEWMDIENENKLHLQYCTSVFIETILTEFIVYKKSRNIWKESDFIPYFQTYLFNILAP